MECKGVSITLPFLDFNYSPPMAFILFSYVKVEAQAFVAHVSLPKVMNPILYDLAIIAFIDDEAQE